MLTLGDVRLALDDLFEKRHADLVRSRAGKYFEPELAALRGKIVAIPAALAGGAPLADQLAAADARHDGLGGVIYFATECVLRDPEASDAQRAAAGRIRVALIPSLGELKDGYSDEAQRARERRGHLTALRHDLASIASPSGGTLVDVAKHFLDAGESLHALLSERGDAAPPDRAAAVALRPATIGLLNELRRKLAQEVASDHKLPRDLVKRVFAYVDVLEAHRHAGHKGPPPSPPAPSSTPAQTA